VIGVYGRLLKGVRSINHLNRVQIALENMLTPIEAQRFAPGFGPILTARLLLIQGPTADPPAGETMGEKLFSNAQQWRTRLQMQMALAGKAVAEGYSRTRLRRDVLLYSYAEATGPKRLLILFTSLAMRPMMPVHVFLQHLDVRTTDVLLLRDAARDGFRSGSFGVGTSLDELVDRLPSLVDLSRYDSVNTMGTSGGGVPALIAGLALAARSAISAGGVHHDKYNSTFHGRPLGEALGELRRAAGSRTSIFLLRGAESPADEAAVEATAALLGATRINVRKEDIAVGHNCLFPLAQQHHFSRVLEAMLEPNTDALREVPALSVSDVARP
jgi:hypothetical protein